MCSSAAVCDSAAVRGSALCAAVRAAVCGYVRQCSVCGSVRQCAKLSAAVRQCVCGSATVCGSVALGGSARGSVRQYVAVRLAICGNAPGRVWQRVRQCVHSVLGSVRFKWQCG
jgi:hypothetical protein